MGLPCVAALEPSHLISSRRTSAVAARGLSAPKPLHAGPGGPPQPIARAPGASMRGRYPKCRDDSERLLREAVTGNRHRDGILIRRIGSMKALVCDISGQ